MYDSDHKSFVNTFRIDPLQFDFIVTPTSAARRLAVTPRQLWLASSLAVLPKK